jgi:hypothetical protein
MRAKALEPVTLVRSPILTNKLAAPMRTGSRPDNSMGGTAADKAATAEEAEKGDTTADMGLTRVLFNGW